MQSCKWVKAVSLQCKKPYKFDPLVCLRHQFCFDILCLCEFFVTRHLFHHKNKNNSLETWL